MIGGNMTITFLQFEKSIFLMLAMLVLSAAVSAQAVDELIENYSGKAMWDAQAGELTFTTAGMVTFKEKGTPKQHFWNVPKEVKTITIEADVRVICAFHSQADLTIRGKHRMTSMVYGTDLRSWAQKHEVKAFRTASFKISVGYLPFKILLH